MVELKITLKHSIIERPQNQRATAKAPDLGKVNSIVTKPANEAVKDMVNIISHLVDVEEV